MRLAIGLKVFRNKADLKPSGLNKMNEAPSVQGTDARYESFGGF